MTKNLSYYLSYFLGAIIYIFGLGIVASGSIQITNPYMNQLLFFCVIWYPVAIELYIITKNKAIERIRLSFTLFFSLLAIVISLFFMIILSFNDDYHYQTINISSYDLKIYTNTDFLADPLFDYFYLRQEKEVFPYILLIRDFQLGDNIIGATDMPEFSYQVINNNEIIISNKDRGHKFHIYLKENVYF